ncbi:hypothetical protein FQN57_006348 [Myotisia sp. PD_48]|nr:hypothetical protein FQN57_006348 [Myotisia sp. PD_48]
MMIQLESGICDSGTDREKVEDIAFECYQNRKYTNNRDDQMPFFCPECQKDFKLVSALFQHAEMRPECETALQQPQSLAKLRRYLYNQV